MQIKTLSPIVLRFNYGLADIKILTATTTIDIQETLEAFE